MRSLRSKTRLTLAGKSDRVSSPYLLNIVQKNPKDNLNFEIRF